MVHDLGVGCAHGFGAEMPASGPAELIAVEFAGLGHWREPDVAAFSDQRCEQSRLVTALCAVGSRCVREFIEEPAPLVDFDEHVDEINMWHECLNGCSQRWD